MTPEAPAAAAPDVLTRMRRDWDGRAEENAAFYIATGAAASEEEFRASGKSDLESVVLDGISLGPAAEALEIGCGVGRLLLPLAARIRKAYGVDISGVMIRKSRAFLAGVLKVRTWVTDGTLRRLEDASLDLVFSYIVFQHIPERGPIETYVREAARVLKPGGLLRFQVDGRWRLEQSTDSETYDGVKFRPKEARELISSAGLSFLEEWGEETHYHWMTALRPGSGAEARFTPRAWDETALRRLFSRFGLHDEAARAARVARGEASLRSELGDLEARWADATDEEYVRGLLTALFGKEPDPLLLAAHARLLADRLEQRASIADAILTGAGMRELLFPFASDVPWFRREAVRDLVPEAADASAFDLLDALEAKLGPLADAELLAAGFERILGRRLDADAEAHHAPLLRQGGEARRLFLREILTAPEGRPVPEPPDETRLAALGSRIGWARETAARGPGESFAGEGALARRLLREGRDLSQVEFVRLAYAKALGREVDPEGEAYYAGRLAARDLNRPGLLRELFWSDEARGR